jgi:hypothetical protein
LRPQAGGDVEHVVVLATLGAPRRGLLERRRTRPADPEPAPTAVSTGRATIVSAGDPLGDDAAAERWLAARRPREAAQREVEAAVDVLNRLLEAHRLASANPFLHEVSAEQALVARLGYGRGEEVADGRWTEAVSVPLPSGVRRRRAAALRPQERLAALLGARETPLASEELVLRARLDLDRGRTREAALGLRVALEAALAELSGDLSGMAPRLEDLRGRRAAVAGAANAAVAGALSPEQSEDVSAALERLEAALRARAAAGPG